MEQRILPNPAYVYKYIQYMTSWKRSIGKVYKLLFCFQYLNQYWKDDRLGFSSNDEVLTLSGDFAEKIWVPDTFFANDKNR